MDDKDHNLPLNPLRAFAIASRYGTFTAAAQHMGITQVAISRQISILEAYLGVKLFERGSRSVKLTEAGRTFGEQIAGLFDELEDATERVLTRERERTINLRIYPTLAHYWLLPQLGAFRALYPDYRIRFDTRIEPLDFRGTHLDVAVQMGDGTWPDARGRKIFDESVDVVCSPDYAERMNHFRSPQDLKHVELIQSKYRRRVWDDWIASAGIAIPQTNTAVYDTSVLAYSAAIQGRGLAMGQISILGEELASGELIRPFDSPLQTGLAIYVLWPTDKSVSTKTRRLIDWMLTMSGQEAQFFTSPKGPVTTR
ncbi:LysR family transcriptional regulator [Pelagibacterium lacus]|uniref:LysR family transcriptional regulator n=2 Tax=Pelagibacterium lacus TaxID=2282655 RepID=A0A369W4U1_9HYPH|nr:LysR family transcriptional regulator [Pelagibacterium lacus]